MIVLSKLKNEKNNNTIKTNKIFREYFSNKEKFFDSNNLFIITSLKFNLKIIVKKMVRYKQFKISII